MVPTKHSSEGSKVTSSTPFGPPFDDDDADTTLRSSDQVDFWVYRVILSKTSSVFKSMFSLPQPDAGVLKKQRPVIDLTENSRTIAVLLTSIYPLVPSLRLATDWTEPITLGDMIDDLIAAIKYDMGVASQHLIQKFAESKVVQVSPVMAFSAAYSHQLGEAARVAAKASLKHRMRLDDIGDMLPYISGVALHQLWKFHRACSATAAEAVSDKNLTWITESHSAWRAFAELKRNFRGQYVQNCQCTTHQYKVSGSDNCWKTTTPWHDYITRAHDILLEHPCSEAVAHHSVYDPSYNETSCQSCLKSLFGLPEFIRLLGEEIERRVSKVDIDLPF